MKILIINGSPKGNYSITLQTALYIEKHHPEHEYHILNAGKEIEKYEKDFSEAASELFWSELILFCSPVYTYLLPSQLHRFFELIKKAKPNLSRKYTSLITTSKHFFDITAHRFFEENCFDLNMKVIKGFSADMDDLLSEKGQKEALDYFDYLLYSIKEGIIETNTVKKTLPRYNKVSPVFTSFEHSGEKKIAIVTDCSVKDRQLSEMIEHFRTRVGYETEVINLHDFPFGGGCTSCLHCASDGECIYKDGFTELLRDRIQACDGIVIAFQIKDHSMGSVFKIYDDRQYCNGHRIVTMGKPFGYIVSGNMSEEENLKMVIEGRTQAGRNFLAGIASDEINPDRDIDNLAKKMIYALENEYLPPADFFGVGGTMIYRDFTWLMQGMVKQDHKFLKEHNQYNFPQNKKKTIAMSYLIGALLSNNKLKNRMGNKLFEGMVAPYQKVIEGKK